MTGLGKNEKIRRLGLSASVSSGRLRLKSFPVSPFSMFKSIRSNWGLIVHLGKHDVLRSYRGSVMDLLWMIIQPLIMLLVYTFVFGYIFQARVAAHGDKFEFAIFLFTGLLIYRFFAECLNASTTLITDHVNFVKKVVFPLEILPFAMVATSLFNMVFSLLILFVFVFLSQGQLHFSTLLFPIVIAPLIILTVGISWILSALGVFIRDVSHLVVMLTSALLFLSPVFYSTSRLPESFQIVYYFNPLTFVIEQSRNVLLHGSVPDWSGLLLYYALSIIVACLGFFLFQKTRSLFADVI